MSVIRPFLLCFLCIFFSLSLCLSPALFFFFFVEESRIFFVERGLHFGGVCLLSFSVGKTCVCVCMRGICVVMVGLWWGYGGRWWVWN